MSKGDSWENDLLLLLFNNTNAGLIGDATGLRGSSTAGSLYVSFHTADPGEAGDQATSEAAYTSYGRVAVARSGAGKVLYKGALSASIAGNLLWHGAMATPKTIGDGDGITFAIGDIDMTLA